MQKIKSFLWFLGRPRYLPAIVLIALNKVISKEPTDAAEISRIRERLSAIERLTSAQVTHCETRDAKGESHAFDPPKDCFGPGLGGPISKDFLRKALADVKPSLIFESGVAYGYSTALLLSYVRQNHAELFSSNMNYVQSKKDFLVGSAIPREYRSEARIFDIPDILAYPIFAIISHFKRQQICLVCYDSDKSYWGRFYAMLFVKYFFYGNVFVLMDDINDNSFFLDNIDPEKLLSIYFDGEKYMALWRI